MTLEEATSYLKKIGEWESVWRFDREIILGWANFLKNKEDPKSTLKKQLNKKSKAATVS